MEIIEYAFDQGWIKAQPPNSRTGKSVGIIGVALEDFDGSAGTTGKIIVLARTGSTLDVATAVAPEVSPETETLVVEDEPVIDDETP